MMTAKTLMEMPAIEPPLSPKLLSSFEELGVVVPVAVVVSMAVQIQR